MSRRVTTDLEYAAGVVGDDGERDLPVAHLYAGALAGGPREDERARTAAGSDAASLPGESLKLEGSDACVVRIKKRRCFFKDRSRPSP